MTFVNDIFHNFPRNFVITILVEIIFIMNLIFILRVSCNTLKTLPTAWELKSKLPILIGKMIIEDILIFK